MEKLGAQCFICGNEFCEEDSDHKKMTGSEFDRLLKERAGFCPEIAHLKLKIRQAFQKVEKKSGLCLAEFCAELMLLVDKLHFWDLLRFEGSLKDVEAAIFGYMLPKPQIIRLTSLLQKARDPFFTFPDFHLLFAEVHKFKKKARIIIENSDYGALIGSFAKIINAQEKEFNHKSLVKTSRCNDNAGCQVEPAREHDGTDFVLIEGFPFSTRRNSLDLSVLAVGNQDLMKYLPSLEKIRNLKELHLRNATLSHKGFRILLGLFLELETLDLSNCPCARYAHFLGECCPSLKTLYINQSGLTDEVLLIIGQQLPSLRVLFADSNQVTSLGAEAFVRKFPRILFVSLKKNQLSEQTGVKLQINLAFQGGYLEY